MQNFAWESNRGIACETAIKSPTIFSFSVLVCTYSVKKSIWKTELYFCGYDENSLRSRKERFIFYLRLYLCTDCGRGEAVEFQFCRKANIVARSPESKIPPSLSLFFAALIARYVKSNVYGTKWSRMNRSTSDGCISPWFLARRLSRLRVIKLPGPSGLPETHPNTV